jgi:S1-C subfamily serine protease
MLQRRDILVFSVLILVALAVAGGVYLVLLVRDGGWLALAPSPTTVPPSRTPVPSQTATETPTPMPTPTATPSSTNTPEPTQTPAIQIVTVVVTVPTPTPMPPTATPRPSFQELGHSSARSLVKLAVLADGEGDASGSGTIVDGEKGLILTNWHIVGDESGTLVNQEGYAGILWAEDPDEPPVLTFMAQVLPEHSDPSLDLAILQITHRVQGPEPVPVEWPLDLPSVPMGDSDQVGLGDPVLLLGYPDYAEGLVSWTEGQVTTHDDEWIRSDALVSRGHSGGMVLDDQGRLIGIASEIQWIGWKGELVKARPINAATALIEQARDDATAPPEGPSPRLFREPEGDLMAVLGTADVALRERPGPNQREIGRLHRGVSAEVLAGPEWDGERYWYHVQPLDGSRPGWAQDDNLVTSETALRPILFTSDQAGSEDLYSILPDGSDMVQLTYIGGGERDASWSPDGDYVVFVYTSRGDGDLYVMDSGGGRPLRLTDHEADDAHPVWSPDGRSIAFVSNRDGDWELYVLDLYHQKLLQITSNGAWDGFPAWSPDSRRLVYSSDRTGNFDLFSVDAAGEEEVQLTTNPHADTHPSWSPKGSEIAYTMGISVGDTVQTTIAVLDLRDPAHPRQLTAGGPDQARQRFPDWSPDGRWIVYASKLEAATELYLVPARGGLPVKLADAPGSGAVAPAWSR